MKPLPVNPTDPAVTGPDIFAKLVPMAAHEASSLYRCVAGTGLFLGTEGLGVLRNAGLYNCCLCSTVRRRPSYFGKCWPRLKIRMKS